MIRKMFHVTAILAIAFTMQAPVLVRAAAGSQLIDPKKATTPVYLNCTWNGPKEFVKVTVTNSTNTTIPQGKTIHWSVNLQTKGSITLQYALAPGRTVEREVPLSGTAPYAPKAWYYK